MTNRARRNLAYALASYPLRSSGRLSPRDAKLKSLLEGLLGPDDERGVEWKGIVERTFVELTLGVPDVSSRPEANARISALEEAIERVDAARRSMERLRRDYIETWLIVGRMGRRDAGDGLTFEGLSRINGVSDSAYICCDVFADAARQELARLTAERARLFGQGRRRPPNVRANAVARILACAVLHATGNRPVITERVTTGGRRGFVWTLRRTLTVLEVEADDPLALARRVTKQISDDDVSQARERLVFPNLEGGLFGAGA